MGISILNDQINGAKTACETPALGMVVSQPLSTCTKRARQKLARAAVAPTTAPCSAFSTRAGMHYYMHWSQTTMWLWRSYTASSMSKANQNSFGVVQLGGLKAYSIADSVGR